MYSLPWYVTQCRAAVNECDVIESCKGGVAECPANLHKADGTSKRLCSRTFIILEYLHYHTAVCTPRRLCTPMYTCVHPLYMYIPPNTPLNTLNTPYIRPYNNLFLKQVLARMDVNYDGEINYREFLQVRHRHSSHTYSVPDMH